ncbi:MAG: hypothetical protein JXB25_12385 [Deltaproteobacteria bacterium]|nr:hypothetical protein [Deltaproteobacteria bacterium]
MIQNALLVFLLLVAVSAQAETGLKPVHPDEPADHTCEQRFSIENALERLGQIRSALDSFRKMTDWSQGQIGREKLEEIGHTEWEIQHLGFENWAGSVEGALYRSDYLIKKLRYELALEKVTSGRLEKTELEPLERDYRRAEQDFNRFWEAFAVAD